MSKFSLVEQLKLLVKAREKAKQLNEKISEVSKQIAVEREQVEKLEKVLKHEQENFLSARKTVDSCELEVRSLRDKETERKEQLDNADKTTCRKALSKDLAGLEASRLELEGELENLWAKLEKSKTHLEIVQQESEKRSKDLEEKISELCAQEKEFSSGIPELESETEKILSSLPGEWRSRLESMESRSGQSPIAQVVSGVCGACFYPISSRDVGVLAKLEPDTLLECQNCFKLLYMEKPEEEPPSQD